MVRKLTPFAENTALNGSELLQLQSDYPESSQIY